MLRYQFPPHTKQTLLQCSYAENARPNPDESDLQHNASRRPDTKTPASSAGVVSIRMGRRSEEHTSELQSLMRISYAVFCLKKKKQLNITKTKKTNNINKIK